MTAWPEPEGMTPHDLSVLVDGLTEAQKRFLLSLPTLKGEKFAPGVALERHGLAECIAPPGRYPKWVATPLGEQVRAHLTQEQSNEG